MGSMLIYFDVFESKCYIRSHLTTYLNDPHSNEIDRLDVVFFTLMCLQVNAT
jgi:hypothetical protein